MISGAFTQSISYQIFLGFISKTCSNPNGEEKTTKPVLQGDESLSGILSLILKLLAYSVFHRLMSYCRVDIFEHLYDHIFSLICL